MKYLYPFICFGTGMVIGHWCKPLWHALVVDGLMGLVLLSFYFTIKGKIK